MYFVQFEEFCKYGCGFSQVIRLVMHIICLSLSSTFVRYKLFTVNVNEQNYLG